MTSPIPLEYVIDVLVAYIVKRQIQGRPTTLRQLGKRVGLGVPSIRRILEKNQVNYILIPYGKKEWVSSGIEIAIKAMPENIAVRNGFTGKQIEDSFQEQFGRFELEDAEEEEVIEERGEYDGITWGPREETDPLLSIDPYFPYRITTEQFQSMKHELITLRELTQEAKKRGYSGRAIERATGGNRMAYDLPGPLWRPYIYRNKKYFLKEVLNYLNQSYKTYKQSATAKLKMKKRQQKLGIEPSPFPSRV